MEASLGKLLNFVGPKKSAEAGTLSNQVDAQILIFTGVRYERGAPPPTTTHADGKRRKRKRV
jgi:hypothetical protein